jgi:hypothetical protein
LSPRGRGRRRRPFAVVLAVAVGLVAITAATAVVYVGSHAGNEALPDGVHTVQVFTVDDAVSTVVAPADRPGALGRFLGMCDADSYYMEVGADGLCLVLNGSLGDVRATGTGGGAQLDAAEAAKVRDIVRREDAGSPEPSTRVVLGYDGGWAGLVDVADLNEGGPVTAGAVS